VKTTVAMQELLEFEIKPSTLLDEYEALLRSSVAEWFPVAERIPVMSPCDATDAGKPAFERLGFKYRECHTTGSLFVSPRPTERALARFYRDSPAASFWRERVLSATEEARNEKLAQPRAEWVLETIAEQRPLAASLLDVSPHSQPLATALLDAHGPFESYVASAPTADLDFRSNFANVEVRPGLLADLPRNHSHDVLLAFDVLARAADAVAFERVAHDTLAPGGLLFVTSPLSSGFEVQLLWERSRTLLPPDKLNVLSLEGLLCLFDRARWEIVELSTPGVLDVEMVRQAISDERAAGLPRFFRYVLNRRGADAHLALQEYLQRHRLASFARLVARTRS
jgi:hypothetical protein